MKAGQGDQTRFVTRSEKGEQQTGMFKYLCGIGLLNAGRHRAGRQAGILQAGIPKAGILKAGTLKAGTLKAGILKASVHLILLGYLQHYFAVAIAVRIRITQEEEILIDDKPNISKVPS